MITADSYMELYGTLIGWYFYDRAWELVVGSGLIFLLAFYWVYINWRGPATSQEARAGFATSVAKMEWEVYTGIILIALFAWPVVPLSVTQIEFELENGQRVNADNNPSVFDGFFPDGEFQDIRVPLFWHGAMQIVAGINSAIIGASPDIPNFRRALTTLDYGYIRDPKLRHEVDRFYGECFRPALARYQNAQNSARPFDLASSDGNEPFWPGSLSMRVLYGRPNCRNSTCLPVLRADEPVSGFPIDAARDVEPEFRGSDAQRRSAHGRPFCGEWWSDADNGLRSRLLEVGEIQGMGPGFLSSVFTDIDPEEEADITVRRLLENRPVLAATNSQVGYANTDRSFIGGILNRATAIVGIEVSTFFKSTGLYGWIRALPIVQGLMLMLLYATAAFLMLLPGMRLQTLVALFVGFFTIKFISVLWHFAYWIEQFFIGTVIDEDVLAVRVHGQALDSQILNYLLLFSYAAIPAAFTVLMGFVGFRAASGVSGAVGSSANSMREAGDVGARISARAGVRVAGTGPRQ
ncbi:MAG: conjugal transfer protein TraG N-terminal domain-containing protein [Pseudomonadota bacterium]